MAQWLFVYATDFSLSLVFAPKKFKTFHPDFFFVFKWLNPSLAILISNDKKDTDLKEPFLTSQSNIAYYA